MIKEFDLEAAKNGAKLCTRDGKPVRIVCYDANFNKPILALIETNYREYTNFYTNKGKHFTDSDISNYDLFIVDTTTFDLEAAKSGAPVCTKSGNNVRILCYDRKNINYPLVGLVETLNGEESMVSWTNEGRENLKYSSNTSDLIMK